MFQKYIVGNGIDVSKEHYILSAKHKYIEPDNLYLLRNDEGVETFDYLYSRDLINETKYFRILLYEWFLVVKENGYIIIEFQDNEILGHNELVRAIATLQLYNNSHKIVEDSEENLIKRIVIQKTGSVRKDEEEINRWTFGIVTNGKRMDLINKAINSIRELKIPHYEIIVCGTYPGKLADDIKYIHFTEKDDKGWITRKKNLICENAKYENIVVIHDRIFFDKDWFSGMKKWDNYFNVLSCPVILSFNSTVPYTNWEALGEKFKLEDDYKLFHTNGRLDISDWDKNVIVPGPLIVLKKSTWKLEKWNEKLFWGDAEDIEYSFRMHKSGIMIRLNPYSKAYASTMSGFVFNNYYEKNIKRLGKFHSGISWPLTLILKLLDFFGFRRNQKIVKYFLAQTKKIFKVTSWREEVINK